MITYIFLSILFLAYFNGANDNFNGVATLWGSQVSDYTRAITLATICTFLGSVASYYFASDLAVAFTQSGFVPDSLVSNSHFILSVVLGAGSTIFLATILGLPVSSTHAIIGGLIGAGYLAAGSELHFSTLGKHFFLPLLLSPILATALSYITYQFLTLVPQWDPQEHHLITSNDRTSLINGAHHITAATISFARGFNDTPKFAALLVLTPFLTPAFNTLLLASVIGIGGLFHANRVAETMSQKITPLTNVQGLTANAVNVVLVLLATTVGLPVSSTHVSVGSIFGIGLAAGTSDKKQIKNIVLSWLLTLPIAATISFFLYFFMNYPNKG